MSEACRSSFPPQSSFASSLDLETTGKAALASDRDAMCPGWVPFLPTFPAGVSAAAPDSRPCGWLLWVTRPGRGARVSWSRVWSQGRNSGAIELPTELPPGCPQAPWASPREARAGPGGGHSSSPARDSSGKGTGLVREGLGEGGLCRVEGTGAWGGLFSLSSFLGLSAPPSPRWIHDASSCE